MPALSTSRVVLFTIAMCLCGAAFAENVGLRLAGSGGREIAGVPRLGSSPVVRRTAEAGEPRGDRRPAVESLARGITSSPIEPPRKDDRTFVINSGSGLDTGCSFRGDGPLVINIPVTRYGGPTNADGTLLRVADLIDASILSPYATLIFPAFDVDIDAPPPADEDDPEPEFDRIFFNGELIRDLAPGNSEFLLGANNVWRLNSFQIPIEKVRFPSARGENGEEPEPAMNEVRIDIDVANPDEEVWCTAVDWMALSIKIMSPIILIHGNNSDGGFYDRQGFTVYLQTQELLYDNSISMPTSPRRTNAARLNTLIPPIVKSFGVDSVHFVVHSKGGLDSREYLVRYQPNHDDDFKVLSYSSLSTPHNGSVLADVAVNRETAASRSSLVTFSGFPGTANALTKLAGVDAGTPDLQTAVCAAFNAGNVGALPNSTVYSAVVGDADVSGNGQIDFTPIDEYLDLRRESGSLTTIHGISTTVSRTIVDTMYQILRSTAGVRVTYSRRTVPIPVPPFFTRITVATVTAVPTPGPLGNDCLVTIPSGLAVGSLGPRLTNTNSFVGGAGRNHSNIADAGVAIVVVPWIINVEKQNGDLK